MAKKREQAPYAPFIDYALLYDNIFFTQFSTQHDENAARASN